MMDFVGEVIIVALLAAATNVCVSWAWRRWRRDKDMSGPTVYACCGADAPGPHHEGCDWNG